MTWLGMQSGRTLGRMRKGPARSGGSSPNACNRGSRHPEVKFPLGKYRLWDAQDPTGLREAAELKRKVVPDRKGLVEGRKAANYLNRNSK